MHAESDRGVVVIPDIGTKKLISDLFAYGLDGIQLYVLFAALTAILQVAFFISHMSPV
jgi:hypothetical protein